MQRYVKIVISTLLLGMGVLYAEDTSIIIKIPKVPEVPKVKTIVPKVTIKDGSSAKTNDEIIAEMLQEKVVIFSDKVAPFMMHKDENIKKDTNKTFEVGDLENGRVAAYLHAPYMDVEEVKKSLKSTGFTVLSTYKVDKKGLATSIVFTNEALEKAASKHNRGFASTLRVTVDKKSKLISISNPIYILKAFMQDEYNTTLAEITLQSIRNNFKGLKNSKEIVKFSILEHYKFMEGMPTYDDMIIVKKGNNEALLKSAIKSKKVLYSQTLSNGSIIVGLKLGKRTTKFVKKIGYHNAGLLPYPVLIEDEQVKMLAPKYYISLMYPMLKMSQFMKISTVPGAITKDIDKLFR